MSKVKVPWVSQLVSEWQGNLLSCCGQLKTEDLLHCKMKQDHNSKGCPLESSRTHEMSSRGSSPASPLLRSFLPRGHLQRWYLCICVIFVYFYDICVFLWYIWSGLGTSFANTPRSHSGGDRDSQASIEAQHILAGMPLEARRTLSWSSSPTSSSSRLPDHPQGEVRPNRDSPSPGCWSIFVSTPSPPLPRRAAPQSCTGTDQQLGGCNNKTFLPLYPHGSALMPTHGLDHGLDEGRQTFQKDKLLGTYTSSPGLRHLSIEISRIGGNYLKLLIPGHFWV